MTRVPLIRRMLWHQPMRAAAAVLVVAASALLMLFLDGVKKGVVEAAASYAGQPGIDLWLARRGTENLIRSSSFLPDWLAAVVAADPLVESAGPLLRAFIQVEGPRSRLTLLGIGYEQVGGPERVVEGSSTLQPGEFILDRGAAHRLGVGVGNTVHVNGVPVRVAGLSDRTNLLGTQIVFARLPDLVALTRAADQVSFVLVRLHEPADTAAFAARWAVRDPEIAVFTRRVFADNSLREVYAGFQPIVGSLALQGAIVSAAVIALILYGRVLERRLELAVLLTLGGTPAYLNRVVLLQALAIAFQGLVVAVGLTLALGALIARYVPEMTFAYAPGEMAWSAGTVLAAALIGAALPLIKMRKVEPGEVFRT